MPDLERVWWRIVALPEGTGGQEARILAYDARQALDIFQGQRGVVGVLEADPKYGTVLNGDRIVYAAVQ